MTVPPVSIAMSSNMAFLLSPKLELLSDILREPLILLTTSVASASPSTSSAIINNGFPVCATGSRTGRRSLIEIFLS